MKPAKNYAEFYKHFYAPRRVAQIVISWALKRPQESYLTFLTRFTTRVDMFGHTYVKQDLLDSVCAISMHNVSMTSSSTAIGNSSGSSG